MSDSGVGRQVALEAVDIGADRGDPAGVDAVFHVVPFAAGEFGFVKGKRLRRFAEHMPYRGKHLARQRLGGG